MSTFSTMHNDYLDPDKHLNDMQEDIACGEVCHQNLMAILSDNGSGNSVADLYRSIYKYTDCGPWLSVQLHDGSWVHCQNLRSVENGNIRALLVGSIVEGSEVEITADPIDLLTVEDPVKTFNETVEWVNTEACAAFDAEQNAEHD